MMKGIITLLICFTMTISAMAQDNCAGATALCANNSIASTTSGATTVGSDPALNCGDNVVNNSVWFTVLAINNGNATITISNINNTPGLEMEVYTGFCGSLAPIGACNSANGPNGSMNVTFATTAGITYYIMVDGTGGNQEAFNINATTANDAIIAKPDANFNTNPANGCIPLSVDLDSTTAIHGGTNITFQWKFDGGSYIPASGKDTTVLFNTLGTHSIDLRVCNSECGCKSVNQDVVVQNLFPSISFLPAVNCLNSNVSFTGSAVILPDPPNVAPNVTTWLWNFGDPNSGINNTASGQFPTHAFVGPGASFTVQLITDGTCGPDTTSTVINLNAQPVVYAGPDQSICEGNLALLGSSIIIGALPISSYNWVGPGTINCGGCDTTTVDDLPAGGPYLFTLSIVDANGCTADTTVNVIVYAKPTVDAGIPQIVCANQPAVLFATPLSGNPPYTYAWDPAAGLNDSTLQSPTARVSVLTSFCVTITDVTGCTSDASCVDVDVYPTPTVTPTNPILCATDPNRIDTFNVAGAGAGSTYSWVLSPAFARITGANVDSSNIYVTFPAGIAANYTFIVVVTDGVTGCKDTVPTTFNVSNGLNMNVNGPTKICIGANATLVAGGAVSYAWTANPSYAFADSTLASQVVSPLVTTVFTIYGTAGTCTQVITDTLRVYAVPVAVAAAIPDFCGCATVNLNGTGSTVGMSYLWTSAGGASVVKPDSIITTSTLCSSDAFTLTVTDPVSGCSNNVMTGANSLPKPDAVADVTPNLVCAGNPTLVNLIGTGSNIAGGTTYHWASNDPTVVISDTSALITDAMVTGPTVFYLTVTDLAGCDSIVSDTVHIYSTPIVTAGPDQFICEGTIATLGAFIISGTFPIQSYNWVGPGTINCTGCDTTTVDDLPAGGPYLFALDIVDANGCTADTTVNVTVNAKPTVDAGTAQITCANQPVTLFATPLSGNPAFTYAWDPAAGLNDSTLQSPTARVSVLTSYCVTVTDATGCTSDASCVDIDVYPLPFINPTIPILCSSNPNLTDTFVVSGAGIGSTYSWMLSPDYALITGATVDSSSIYVTFAAGVAANYSFIAIVTDGITSCKDTIPVTFSVTNGLNVDINGPALICNGATATLVASGAISYAWTANPPYAFTDSTLASQGVSPAVTTVFTVYGTAGPCVQAFSDTMVVNPNPVANVVNIPDFCGCATVNLDGTGSTPGMNYLWSSTGGSTITSPSSLNTTSSICASETFDLTVTDPVTGCFSADNASTNSIAKPGAVATIGPLLICPGVANVINLNGNGSNIAGGTTYLWTSNDPSVVIAAPTLLITTANVSATTIFYLTVTNVTGCDSTVSDTVKIFPPPVMTASPLFLCTADPLQQSTLSITGAGAGSTYSWDVVPGCAIPNAANTSSQLFDFGICGVGSYVFTVSVTDGVNSCVDTVTQTVTVVTGVTLTMSNDTAICEGSSVTVSANGANSYLWNTTDTTSSVTFNNLVVAGSPYVFRVTGTVGSCSAIDSVIVTVNPVPVTGPISGASIVCENDTGLLYSVTPAAGNYSWTVTGGSITTGQGTDSITVNWGAPGIRSVSVVDTNAFNCAGTPQSMTVTINPVPITSPINGSDTVCENSVITYFIVPNAGSAYNWIATGGAIIGSSTSSFVNVVWSPSGTGTISVSETNVVGCSSAGQSMSIQIDPQPLPVVVSGNNLLCQDDTMQIYSTTANAGSTHTWVVTRGAIVSGQGTDSILVNWSGPGLGIIAAIETNTFGCSSDTSYFNVTLNAQPAASGYPDTLFVCQSNALPIPGSVNAGTIHWTSTGAGSFSDTTIASPTYTPTATDTGYYTLTMVASNPPCFNDTAIVTIYVKINPTVTVSVTQDSVCSGTADTLTATGGGSYLWNSNGDTTAVSIVNPINTAFYSVTVTNSIGCSITDSILITAIPIPATSAIAGRDSVCEFDTVVVYSVTPQIGNYTWSVTGGVIVAGSGTDSIVVNWDSAGVAGVITVVDTNTFGCAGPLQTLNVTIVPLPMTPAISGSDTACQNSTTSYFISSSAGSTYNWTASGGVIQGSATDTIVNITWVTAGIGVVTVSETNTLGCVGVSQNRNVVINPAPVTPAVIGNLTFCEGDSLQVYSVNANAGSTYAWTVVNGTLLSGQSTDSIQVNWGISTTGTIILLETNSFGCTSDSSINAVNLVPPGVATATGDSLICFGDSAHLSGSFQNATGLFWSSLGDGTFIPDTTSLLVSYVPGPADSVALGMDIILVTTGGCLNGADTMHVAINALPTVFAGIDQDITIGSSFGIPVQLNGVVHYASGGTWTSSGSGTFSPDDSALNATYMPSSQDYQLDSIILALTTYGGCRIVSDFMVIDITRFTLPNVITPYPASPGVNDFFTINNLAPNSKLKIWDRWGTLVYVTDYYQNDWDAAELKADTYYYSLMTEGKEYRGWIKVFRGN